eukprot:13374267-Ditylum_brightwellii.AAC.1
MDISIGKNTSAWDDVWRLVTCLFRHHNRSKKRASNDTFMAWQAEVCAGFNSKNQYSFSGDWNDEPDLRVKPFDKTIANQAVVLHTMNKK